MKRQRRLRKLVPDAALIRRRAAGEPLRELASDYDVAHTTLGRYFQRPEVAKQVKQAAAQLRAEQRAAAARHAAERRLEQEVRRKAKEQAATERKQARGARAAENKRSSRPDVRAAATRAGWTSGTRACRSLGPTGTAKATRRLPGSSLQVVGCRPWSRPPACARARTSSV